jgi:hypothetical protein
MEVSPAGSTAGLSPVGVKRVPGTEQALLLMSPGAGDFVLDE